MLQSIKKICVAAVAALVAVSVMAGVDQLPVKTVNGRQYHYYEVQPKETVYSLCRRFDISRDELVRYNPSVEDGLKAYQVLLFPVSGDVNDKAVSAPASTTINYMVQKKETGYGISRRFGMTLDEFYQLNPSARDGLKAGQMVVVRAPEGTKPDVPAIAQDKHGKSNPDFTYTVQSGDTYYGIANRYGVSVEQLMEANTTHDVLRPGMVLTIPQSCSEGDSADGPAGSVISETTVTPGSDAEESLSVELQGDTMVIAVVLPFCADASKRESRSVRAIEFYRGMVIALDSMRNVPTPVRLMAYDTKGSDETVAEILRDSRLKRANVIIAPDVASHLDSFAVYAKENRINLLNLFVIKDEDYRVNPYMMNANIPHDAMYAKAIKYFLSTYPDVTPVFIKRKDGKDDKAEFVSLFKEELNGLGRKYHEIEYADKLSAATLEKLPAEGQYAFIPNSSNMTEFQTFIDAIVTDRESRINAIRPSLWGYSEWLTARGKNLERLHDANTVIFSRFYTVEKDPEEEVLQSQFSRWYGTRIQDKVPKQGTYGFDTGVFLIKALNANKGDFSRSTPLYNGLQNAFDFIQVPGGGWVNNEMFMINFAPGGFTTKYGI